MKNANTPESTSPGNQGVGLEFLSYAQAAEFLNISINTLYWYVHTGKIRHVRYSKRMVRFRREDLRNWSESHIVEARSEE